MASPGVLGGRHLVHSGSVLTTASGYGLVVMTLALLALLGALKRKPGAAALAC